MQKENTFVVNLGGSIIVPEEIDGKFLKEFRDIIVKQIEEKDQKFVFITGGGKTARNYASVAGEISEHVTNEDKDWLGIHATRLNAHLVRTIFRDYAYPRINTNPHDLEDFYKCKEPIIIAAGWRPGFSTDYDTALLAKYLEIGKMINLSNIDYIYDKDPNKFSDAKKLDELSWNELQNMIDNKWTPGMNAPFDPVAIKFSNEENLELITMNGRNLENLKNYLNGDKFEGSVVKNG
ncbi:MAG: UMP kinase [Methylococcales bacterium]|nr:UMP kinase [Candidatus Moranbacteria bacterium]MCK4841296.1 UMP kinase [Methylococcales bacterium]